MRDPCTSALHLFIAIASVAGLLLGDRAAAQEFEEVLVYIECREGSDGRPRGGSGVIVSEDGYLVTARHVLLGQADELDPATECYGSKGSAHAPKSRLVIQEISSRYDAALLGFPGSGHAFMTWCPILASDRMEPIYATGFPLGSTTGTITARVGVLATTQPTAVAAPSSGRKSALIETDAATTTGMSGGMVSFRRNGRMIGIVSGMEPDIRSQPKYYGILPVKLFANEFDAYGLREAEDCPPLPRHLGPFGANDGINTQWSVDRPPLDLGIGPEEGFCFLVSVWGTFDVDADSVEIGIDAGTGNYILTGHRAGSGRHGGIARCVRF